MYTITWLLCAFLLAVDRDLLEDKRTEDVSSRQRIDYFMLQNPPRSSINHLYKTNRLHFPVCVHCNRSQKTSQRVKNNSHATRLRLVSYFLFCCDVICDLLQYTHIYYSTHNLFVKQPMSTSLVRLYPDLNVLELFYKRSCPLIVHLTEIPVCMQSCCGKHGRKKSESKE